jgi:hypothetical protein
MKYIFKINKNELCWNLSNSIVPKCTQELFLAQDIVTYPGLDISQGTVANGCGALTDWPCALKKISICQGHAQLKWP